MKFSGVSPNPDIGLPAYVRDKDTVQFKIGSGREYGGVSFKEVPLFDQWQIANVRYRRGGSLIVSDFQGKGPYRTWRVQPVPGERNGVELHPLHDDGEFFRGTVAYATEPLVMSRTMKPLVDHLTSQEKFDRVSVASTIKKGWGDVSRMMALLHNYGFIESTGTRRTYTTFDPAVESLKSEKDRTWAIGGKTEYRKSATWPSFLGQFESFIQSGEKTMEVEVTDSP